LAGSAVDQLPLASIIALAGTAGQRFSGLLPSLRPGIPPVGAVPFRQPKELYRTAVVQGL